LAALNAIAAGGSFISFPALLITGIPPIPATPPTPSHVDGRCRQWRRLSPAVEYSQRVMVPLVASSVVGG